jgi:biotin-[acetyl-CoA-carboxylase] ligase BirA-like protein
MPCAGSTNDEVRSLAEAGAPDGTIVIAGRQTAGRGRMGRAWHSAEGRGLYLSVLLRPTEPIEWIGRYALTAAVGACSACRAVAGPEVRIKWPNDLLAGGAKLGGILAEARSGPGGHELAVGFGVNLNHLPDEFPPEIREAATSLRSLRGGEPVDREEFAVALLAAFGSEIAALRGGAWIRVADRFLRYAPSAEGARVRLATGEEGVTSGLDLSGALRVATARGVVLVHASESFSAMEV